MDLLQKDSWPHQAFGKLTRNPQGHIDAWLPLVDHMTDVALCFARLCDCRNIRRALEHAAGRPLNEYDIARLSALAFLHDLGKANSGFQSKRWRNENRPSYWPGPSGHGREAIYLLSEDSFARLVDALPIDRMLSWGHEALISLLTASISHHGRPLIEDETDLLLSLSKTLWKPVTDVDGNVSYDPLPIIEEISQRVKTLFPEAFGVLEQALPNAPAFAHLFAGLVQFADWLGSDTRHFPIRIDADRCSAARAYADNAVGALGLDTRAWREELNAAPPSFQTAFGIKTPHPIQSAMNRDEFGPLLILESETGSGKTEAALWRFAHLFRAGSVDSLYFALPTRVSAKQVYERTRAAIARLWPDNPPLTVRALPGYAAADGEEPVMLPEFKVQWNDHPNDEKAHRRWAAEGPKRFLAAPVAVGTIDQALLGILKVRHAHMRYALLARSLLVVDEVHASDAYMTVLLERLLKTHLDNGGHALLLSATLGSSARARYLSLDRAPSAPRMPSFDEACAAAYPALSDSSALRPMAATGHSKPVHWFLHACMDDPAAIAALAIKAADSGAKVLVVRNTVPSAIAVLNAIEQQTNNNRLFSVNGIATLHHSRFSRQDRPLLDDAINAALGKHSPPGPRIVIGTQTLEQSLDIDADLLISDLCPMDVLLQRIGRLHRHQRNQDQRPLEYASPQALILTPGGHDLSPMLTRSAHGLGQFQDGGGIYPDLRIIELTRRLIEQHPMIEIPADNRRLVESATHPERISKLEQELGTAWLAQGQKIAGDSAAKRSTAHLQALEIDKPFALDANMAFPTDHKIATRLGAEDKLLEFDPALIGPFGEPLRQLPIRHYLTPKGLTPDARADAITQQQGNTEFSLGDSRYRYSRLGLEKLTDENS
jgi:CRISPR-associated endonuclease/helicase Cas3